MNALDKVTFKKYIQSFDFTTLFNELGWDYLNEYLSKKAGDKTFSLKAVAHKEGFRIFVCNPDEEGKIPDSSFRKKIHAEISRLYFEHLIIFVDRNKATQVWQLIIREHGKPQRINQVTWYRHQEPELLYQRLSGVFFTIDETDKLTIVDVTHRLKENFGANAEKVTKKFYDVFKTEHTRFLKFLKGIEDNIARDWYASLMLNRLMFCYFIQKKGFLNNDKNYLRNKLKEVQAEKGKDKFFKFYYDFLKTLFHEGLGSPNHSEELKKIIGTIPYLNGGLFDTHRLETEYPKIQIDDAAFEHIFKFFDEWEWHLDTRITTPGKDINPDVIGYIFEKYINDRASMGAYYTKEDITDYIGKNCIIPYLFDEVKRSYPKAFNPDGEIWKLLQTDPDKYIYDAVKQGISVNIHETDLQRKKLDKALELPDQIANGLDVCKPDLLERRKEWNKPARPEYALPTEIWREVVERRKRYAEIKTKIENSEIHEINDFVTYNLNIRQFVQDVIENTDDPEFIRYFYKALLHISILDPTCGSGAFLFAAINILEPLYKECLRRMENFVTDAKNSLHGSGQRGVSKYKFFEETLAAVKSPEHPNPQYYIFKNIILKNIYGVDIMHEAVEIAKLRLFLKLVSTVDVDYKKPNLGLEPLPDIDFNIRAGNTLVGFATLNQIKDVLTKERHGKVIQKKMLLVEDIDTLKRIDESAEMANRAFQRFKEMQTDYGMNAHEFTYTKSLLNERLEALEKELNSYLAREYSIDINEKTDYQKWLTDYKPFHWFIEFYGIMNKGGFDVIIGNPPYLEFRQINYALQNYNSADTKAVHAVCIERSSRLINKNGAISMIVPLSIVSTQRMKIVQEIIEDNRTSWFANYSWRPAKLFDTVNRALTIFVAVCSANPVTFSTTYQKWISETREELMDQVCFSEVPRKRKLFWIPKISSSIETSILQKFRKFHTLLGEYFRNSNYHVYYRTTGGLYWKVFTDFPPEFKVNGKSGHSSRETWFSMPSREHVKPTIALLSSNVFWWWHTVTSNCRDLNPFDIQNFPINEKIFDDINLQKLGFKYLIDLQTNSIMLVREQKQTGKTETQCFKIQKSKSIIDEIDKVLAQHYGFTDEELDFIINYDIKYRMGKELEAED